ncbi:MAG: universal stress protein [Fuerstiella sp.]|nr:universal stress protein [Fuerstiella sp.]
MTDSEVPTFHSNPAQCILHPTDFSPHADLAFGHALRVAIRNKALLSILHVGKDTRSEWDRFPGVRQTLQNWGLLDSDARRADVAKIGVDIEKIIAEESDIPGAIAGYEVKRPVDLLVLATEGRSGLSALLRPSKGQQAARKLAVPTLFVPGDGRGCVSLETGDVSMDEVLIPVDHTPTSDAAIERGLRAIEAFGHEKSRLTLLHVGPESEFPEVRIPDGPWHVTRTVRQGNPATEILDAAEEISANLIIMVTEGAHGYLDILRGTTSENVLRQAPCPVLTVPASF